MSNFNSGELLSAFYDGETSPEEFAIVERLLETSAEARRELDEIGELSDLLHSLPRQTAPVELASSVLSRAERESLLPHAADLAESAESLSPQVSRLRLATGLVTVAAALLLVVFVVNRPVPDPSDSTHMVQQRSSEQTEETAERDAVIATANAEPADRSVTGGYLVDGVGSPQTLSTAESKADIRSFSKSALNASRLRDVQIGDVIPYFAVAQNRVAVLEVTVIDVQKAVGITQLLLEGNHIPQIAKPNSVRIRDGSLESKQALKPADQTQKTTDGVFAVYVESSESQLAETMEQLRQQGILADLKLRPPVELSQVKLADSDFVAEANVRSQQKQEQASETLADVVTQGRLLRVQRIALSAAIASPNAQPQTTDKLSSKVKSNKFKKDTVPKRDDTLSRKAQRDLKTTSADKPGETGNAFQMLINVLPRSLTEKTFGTSSPTKQPAAEAVKKSQRTATTTRLKGDSVTAPPRPDEALSAPIRVILVFQGQLPAEAVKPE